MYAPKLNAHVLIKINTVDLLRCMEDHCLSIDIAKTFLLNLEFQILLNNNAETPEQNTLNSSDINDRFRFIGTC